MMSDTVGLEKEVDKEETLNSQLAITVSDRNLGLLGYLVIDKYTYGKSCGGIRMAHDITQNEISPVTLFENQTSPTSSHRPLSLTLHRHYRQQYIQLTEQYRLSSEHN